MRNLVKTVVVLALFGSRVAMAETAGKSSDEPQNPIAEWSLAHQMRWIGGAPIGHRQPHTTDVPSEDATHLEQLSAEDVEVDRKLNICRGC